MNKILKKALKGSILASGDWADYFDSDPPQWYEADFAAGERALKRAGRGDLAPALRKRCAKWSVSSLSEARGAVALIEELYKK